MITLVSPAKKLDFSHSDISSQFSQCDFLNKSQILIDETKKTRNRLLEIPEKVLKTTKNYSSVSSHLYDVDSITRRSRPLQQTKDALSQFSEDQ